MKVIAGTWIAPDFSVHLLNRGTLPGGPFRDLNGIRLALADLPFVPAGDLEDFGRGCMAVRYSLLTAVLTAGDHGAPIPPSTGVYGWNGRGCTTENLRYWNDYTANGCTGGRGGLFVATLPSIPCCEAAIALGCHGPATYLKTESSTWALFCILATRPPGLYLVGEVMADQACMLLVDTVQPDLIMPDCFTLADLFRVLKEARSAR